MIDLKEIPNSPAEVSSSNYECDSNDNTKFFNNGFYDSYYIKKSSRIPTPPPTASSNFLGMVKSSADSRGDSAHKNLMAGIFNKINQPDFNKKSHSFPPVVEPIVEPVVVEDCSFSSTRSLKIRSAKRRRIIDDDDSYSNTNDKDINAGSISQITTISKVRSLRRLKSLFSFMHKAKPESKAAIDHDEDFCSNSFLSFNNNSNTSRFDAMSFSTDCEAKSKYCWPSPSECLSGTTLTQSKENNKPDLNDCNDSIISVSSGVSAGNLPKKSKNTLYLLNGNSENAACTNSDELKDQIARSSSLSFRNFFSSNRSSSKKNITKEKTRRKHFRDFFKFKFKNVDDTNIQPFDSVETDNLSTNLDSTKRKSIRKKISTYFYNNSRLGSVSNLENENDNTTMNSSWNPENLDNPYDIAANNSRISLRDIIPETLLKDVDNNYDSSLTEKINQDSYNEKGHWNGKPLDHAGNINKNKMIFSNPFNCEISDTKGFDNDESFKRKIEISKLVFELDNFSVNKNYQRQPNDDNEKSSSAMFFSSPSFEEEENAVKPVINNYSNRISISKF